MKSMMKSIMKSIIYFLMFVLIAAETAYPQTSAPTIKTNKITENLYEFFVYIDNDNSVNLFAFIGTDGVLMIDAGYRTTTALVKEELKRITEKEIKFIINTHYDGDHTGGNAVLGEGAVIIAHRLSRDMLSQNQRFPCSGLPRITFQDSMVLHFNGEEIALKYFPGHTNSDIIIHFRTSNFVFTGDLVFSDMFPVIHPDGSLDLLVKSISSLSEMFQRNTRIFTGHGREIKTEDLSPYLDMIKHTKEIVLKSIQDGKIPDEAKKDNILKDWRKWDSKLFKSLQADGWIDNLYNAIKEGREMSAVYVLKKEYQKSGPQAMIDFYKKITAQKKKKHSFNENDFNTWGYELLGVQKTLDAIEVFRINTEIFPHSSNAYDSLGEAFMIAGKTELAVKNYEKSLELNPNNKNALEQLKILKTKSK